MGLPPYDLLFFSLYMCANFVYSKYSNALYCSIRIFTENRGKCLYVMIWSPYATLFHSIIVYNIVNYTVERRNIRFIIIIIIIILYLPRDLLNVHCTLCTV